MRIGFGYDVHEFERGGELMLCGVKLDYPYSLKGHSDADVAIHALCDAMLGAAALGDIGKHFPDTDPAYKGIASKELLAKVSEMLTACGYHMVNADLTVVAQKPRLSPYIEEMRSRLADILGVDISCVSVKATTEENLGFTGRLEGIKAYAVCLVDNITKEA